MVTSALIIIAMASAAAVALGCDPAWADRAGGVEFIRWMYRLQWLFIGTTVASSLALVGLVVTSQRRGYWLFGLLPVVLLLGWRFGWAPVAGLRVDDAPVFVQALGSDWLTDESPILGVVSGEQAYALPVSSLAETPVVVHTMREQRLLVFWSEGAKLATACRTDRSLRGRDLRIVAQPRGVLLLFNSRLGEFFDALTLAQRSREPFTGFESRLPVVVTTWQAWKKAHPDTRLLESRRSSPPAEMPQPPTGERVIFVATSPPIIVPLEEFSGDLANVTNGKASALLFRDGRGRLAALERRTDGDLFLRFEPAGAEARKGVAFVDTDTQSGWTIAGECIDGPLAGKRLSRLVTIADVPADAARYWVR